MVQSEVRRVLFSSYLVYLQWQPTRSSDPSSQLFKMGKLHFSLPACWNSRWHRTSLPSSVRVSRPQRHREHGEVTSRVTCTLYVWIQTSDSGCISTQILKQSCKDVFTIEPSSVCVNGELLRERIDSCCFWCSVLVVWCVQMSSRVFQRGAERQRLQWLQEDGQRPLRPHRQSEHVQWVQDTIIYTNHNRKSSNLLVWLCSFVCNFMYEGYRSVLDDVCPAMESQSHDIQGQTVAASCWRTEETLWG